nr:hypothetical protein [Tanacetum cinerariifolium]
CPEIHPPSQEISDEVFQAKGDLMKSIQTFLEEFNYIPFEEKPKILLQAWYKFFTIQHAQPEDPNELFQKLLEDLKELAEYANSLSRDRLSFFDNNEDHSVQYKENLENSSNSNQENEGPPQDFNIRQLIREEWCIEKLLKDLKELAEYNQSTNTDRPIFLNDNHPKNSSEENYFSKTNQEPPQDSDIHQLIEECSVEFLCIHDDIDNLIESALDSKLLLINSVNSQRLDKKEQEVKNVVEQPAGLFTTFSNPLFKDNDDLDSSNNESLSDKDVPAEEFKIYSNPLCDEDKINFDKLDPHCFNVESDFVESLLNRDTFIDFSSKFDFSGELAHIKPEIPKSDVDFEEEILQDGNSQQEEIDIVTETDDVLPPSVENDDDDYDLLLGEADLFLSDDSIPPEELNAEIADTIIKYIPLLPIPVQDVMEDNDEPDEHFNPGGEINVSTKTEDVDYFPFIRFFLSYFIFPEISPLLLSAESEDTIFDPVISN